MAYLSCELCKLVEACTAGDVVDCLLHLVDIADSVIESLQSVGEGRGMNRSVAG